MRIVQQIIQFDEPNVLQGLSFVSTSRSQLVGWWSTGAENMENITVSGSSIQLFR
jgi:hypothetical protein